MNNMGTAAQL